MAKKKILQEPLPNLFEVDSQLTGRETPTDILESLLDGARKYVADIRGNSALRSQTVLLACAERIEVLTKATEVSLEVLNRHMEEAAAARVLSLAIKLGSEVTAALSVQLHALPVLKQRKAAAQLQQASANGAAVRRAIGKTTVTRLKAEVPGSRVPISERHERRLRRGK